MITRDPSEHMAVGAVICGVAAAIGCLAAALGLALEERAAAHARPRRRTPRRGPALRRGLALGVTVAALGLLRAIDGLTIVTGGFVVAGFALAELVLMRSARPAARSG
ncbi:MAG TPA: hypothetical protein VGR87_11925 [Candidatus Limnocylindria bacterium]|nr:hypothetical protein [Candidatus Limnocylindria bacterium]